MQGLKTSLFNTVRASVPKEGKEGRRETGKEGRIETNRRGWGRPLPSPFRAGQWQEKRVSLLVEQEL